MKYYLVILVFILIGIASDTQAASAGRVVTIGAMHPISVARSDTNGQPITRVYVNGAAWGATTCRTDAADLHNEDTHLATLLLVAWTTGKQITINVDDSMRPIDTVCRITSLTIH